MADRWVRLYCACGHIAEVKLPDEPWQHRDRLLPRAVCTVCGRKGADWVQAIPGPDTVTGAMGYRQG